MKFVLIVLPILLGFGSGEHYFSNNLFANVFQRAAKLVEGSVSILMSSWIDTVLSDVPMILQKLNMTEVPLAPLNFKYSKPLFGIRLHGEVSISGFLGGLDTFRRQGRTDIQTNILAATVVATFDAGFTNLSIRAVLRSSLMETEMTNEVNGTIADVRVRASMKVVLGPTGPQAELETLEIAEVGRLHLLFDGLEPELHFIPRITEQLLNKMKAPLAHALEEPIKTNINTLLKSSPSPDVLKLINAPKIG